MKKWIGVGMMAVVVGVAWAGDARAGEDGGTTAAGTADVPAAQPAATTRAAAGEVSVEATGFGAMGYFEDHCARCHGPGGSFFGDGFAKGKSDERLGKRVSRMASGPGNAPVDERQLGLLVDYLKHVAGKAPYVEVVRVIERDGVMEYRGEATAGSVVTLGTGDKAVVAERDGDRWTANVAAGEKVESVSVSAGKGE